MMSNLGCYSNCTFCSKTPNCCANFDRINAPVLSKTEILKIMQYINLDSFYRKAAEGIFQLKIVENKCIFYKSSKCTIYEYRPIDCRLYPYDIIKKGLKYYLIIYLLECIDTDNFTMNNPCNDELIKNVIPWINDFTDEVNYTKMKKYNYKIIKELNI